MWVKYLLIILLFYLSALVQKSFLVHFSLFGASLNLVFIIFFLFVFFSAKSAQFLNWQIIFYAISAGLFLDIFSYSYFGASIILLLFGAFLIKKIQAVLHEIKNDSFPFVYFLPLFIVSFTAYNLLLSLFLSKFNLPQAMPGSYYVFFIELAYNSVVACAAFYVFKKLLGLSIDNRQLSLFKN